MKLHSRMQAAIQSGRGPGPVDVWKARIAALSLGPISSTAEAAARAYCTAMSNAGLFNIALRINLDVGPALATSMVPLVNTSGAAVDSVTGTVTHSDALGWASDGTTGYIKTGLLPTANGGLGVYVRDAVTSSTTGYCPIGCAGPSTSQVVRVAFNRDASASTAGSTVSNWGGTVPLGGVAVAANIAAGYRTVDRFGPSLARALNSGAQTGTDNTTTVSVGTPGVELYVLAQNNNGTVALVMQAAKHVSGYAVFSRALSLTERAAEYAAMQAFQTAMSRNV